MDIGSLRKEYRLKKLRRQDLDPNPFEQFKRWWEEALKGDVIEPNAFALATSDALGAPTCRMVLLKQFDERGLLFFTSLESNKAQILMRNPQASALFWWKELERQIRIEGAVKRASQEETLHYFARRPRKSQLGAWTSHQDDVIASRAILEEAFKAMEKQFDGSEIPPPDHWGGFWILPKAFEFWQGREDRLHDRFRYSLHEEKWLVERLSP